MRTPCGSASCAVNSGPTLASGRSRSAAAVRADITANTPAASPGRMPSGFRSPSSRPASYKARALRWSARQSAAATRATALRAPASSTYAVAAASAWKNAARPVRWQRGGATSIRGPSGERCRSASQRPGLKSRSSSNSGSARKHGSGRGKLAGSAASSCRSAQPSSTSMRSSRCRSSGSSDRRVTTGALGRSSTAVAREMRAAHARCVATVVRPRGVHRDIAVTITRPPPDASRRGT